MEAVVSFSFTTEVCVCVVLIFLLIVEKMNRKQIELVVKPASYNRMVVNINKKISMKATLSKAITAP